MTAPARSAPEVSLIEASYWRGGRDGKLHITGCSACLFLAHPPQPVCPRCHSFDVVPRELSGEGSVWSFTVNHYPWSGAHPPPYILVIVELREQQGLRIFSELVDVDPSSVRIDMPVRVRFLPLADGVFLPVFGPAS